MAVNESLSIQHRVFPNSVSDPVIKQFMEVTGRPYNENDLTDGEIEIFNVLDEAAYGNIHDLEFYFSEVECDQPNNAHRIASAALQLAPAGKMQKFLEMKQSSYSANPYRAMKDQEPAESSEFSTKVKTVAICGMLLIASVYGIQQAKPLKAPQKAPEAPKQLPQRKMQGPLPKDQCHPDDAPFHLRVTSNHGPSVKVPSSLTWKQISQKVWNSVARTVFGSTDANAFRREGVKALKNWGESRSAEEIARHPQNEEHDAVYIQKWQLKEQCPSDLTEYIEYQARNGYFNGLNPKVLSPLLGDRPDMSDGSTRGLYKILDKHIPLAVQKIHKKGGNCLDRSMVASTIRSNAREYSRQRMADRNQVKILQDRDLRVHGTDVLDPSYVIGKYADANMTKTCNSIAKAAQETNWVYTLLSKIF